MASPLRGLRNVRVRQARLLNRVKNKYPHLANEIDTIQFDWYRVRNVVNTATGAPQRTEIFIYDEIGGPCSDIQANTLVEQISGIETPEILVRINSPGGSVYDAISIYNALVQHDAHVTTRVESMCASAATIIAMAGHNIEMMLGSQMMIHEASAIGEGDAATLRDTADWLDKQSANIATMYATRTPETRNAEQWRDMMRAETWMYGQEAIDFGLADSMYQRPPRGAVEPEVVQLNPPGDDADSIAELEDAENGEIEALELMMAIDHVAAGRTRKYKHTDRAHAPSPSAIKDSMAALAANW